MLKWLHDGTLYVFGIALIAFSLFFVSLNHLTEYFFIAIAIIFLIHKLSTHDWQYVRTSLNLPIILFLGWILLTAPFAIDPAYSFVEWRKALPRFLLFYFVVNTVKTVDHIRLILFASALGAGVLCFLEVGGFLFEGGNFFDLSTRAGTLTGSSQWLSNYVVIGLPIVWIGLCNPSSRWISFAYIFLVVVILLGALVTNTRAAWVAMFIQALVYCSLCFTRRAWVTGAVAVLTIALVFLVLFFQGDMAPRGGNGEIIDTSSMGLRFTTWSFTTEQIIEHFFTGIGYGKHSFGKAYPDLGPAYHTHIHNAFLSRTLQLGIPGCILFAWIFYIVLQKSFAQCISFQGRYMRKVGLTVLLVTTGVIVRNLFDDMFIGTVVSLFFLISGLLFVVPSGSATASQPGKVSS